MLQLRSIQNKLIIIKTRFFIFVFFYFTISLNAQDEMSKADFLRSKGNYALELKYHLLLFEKKSDFSENVYKMASCYAMLKNIDSAFYYLNMAIDLGENDGRALADCDFNDLHSDHRWREIETKLEQTYILKNRSLDTKLGWKIAKMYFDDQAPKIASDIVLQKYGIQSLQMDSVNKIIANTDSLNMLELENIFKIRGWTGKDLVGLEGADRAFIIILHAPLSFQKKYFEMIKTAVEKGDIRKSSLAYLTDKILTKEGKRQLYGTQLKYSYQTKSYQFKPIEDEKNVNIRRSQVGLEPIEEYGKNFGIIYKN